MSATSSLPGRHRTLHRVHRTVERESLRPGPAPVRSEGLPPRPGAASTGPEGPAPSPRVRAVTPEDREALIRTVDRCSDATRYARFHEHLPALPLGWARRICRSGEGRVVVAAVVVAADHVLHDDPAVPLGAPCDDEIVGLAQVEQEFGTAELTVFVEDAYHRRGVGGLLVRAALTEAAARGIRTVNAHVLPDNDPIRRLLASLDVPLRQGHDDGKMCWTVDISGLARP